MTNDHLVALHSSVARLRQTVEGLSANDLAASAYPSEWTIADVLSHIGSGAVIMARHVDDVAARMVTDPEFATSVWSSWNAKTPAQQAADALVADRVLLDRVDALTAAQWAALRFSLGPMSLDLAGFLGLRLNEHALHSWHIEVALDPTATVAPDAAALVIDGLELIARFAGKAIGEERVLRVRTSEPVRDFTLMVGAAGVSLTSSEPHETPDLELPAEAFIRLVYGRLDPAHTPPISGADQLDELRQVFPGV